MGRKIQTRYGGSSPNVLSGRHNPRISGGGGSRIKAFLPPLFSQICRHVTKKKDRIPCSQFTRAVINSRNSLYSMTKKSKGSVLRGLFKINFWIFLSFQDGTEVLKRITEIADETPRQFYIESLAIPIPYNKNELF